MNPPLGARRPGNLYRRATTTPPVEEALSWYGADSARTLTNLIHIDVTDSRFVPNITIRTSPVELGGGQNGEGIGEAIRWGANAIIVGAAIFGAPYYAAPISAVRQRPDHQPERHIHD